MHFEDIKCNECYAFKLRTEEQIRKIEKWYSLFLVELELIKDVKVILLGESFPANRYFYDLDSNYDSGGLMYNLKKEFEIASNYELIRLFRELGIVVYDCAYCPLHLLNSKAEQRHAATNCLKSYKLNFFHENDVPIITFFPSKRGFLKRELPELSAKICSEYLFSSLHGIKQTIINYL